METKGIVFFGQSFAKIGNEKEIITENVKRILNTKIGERVGFPSYGSRVKELIFSGSYALEDILTEIKASIEKLERRVIVQNIVINSNENEEVKLTIYVLIKNTQLPLEIGVSI